MEPDEKMIARRLSEMATQAGPLQVDDQLVLRLARRRRRLRGAGAGTVCAVLTAGAVGIAPWWSGHFRHTMVTSSTATAARTGHVPKFCGATRLSSPVPVNPRASEPPDQGLLDSVARQIDAIAGGGKTVLKGGKAPGAFAAWYGGSEISNEWREVIVYRVPGSSLDTAICQGIRNVTVELRDALRSAAATNLVANRISVNMATHPQHDFKIYSLTAKLDGRIEITTDHVEAARKGLAADGPYLIIKKGTQSATPF